MPCGSLRDASREARPATAEAGSSAAARWSVANRSAVPPGSSSAGQYSRWLWMMPASVAAAGNLRALAADGLNLAGIKRVLELQEETSRLQAELAALRERAGGNGKPGRGTLRRPR